MLIKILFESSLVDLKLEGASYSSCSVIDVAVLPISWGDLANSFKPLLHHVDINLLISIKFSFDRSLKPEKALIVLLPTIHPDSFWCVLICQTKEQQILEWNYHNRRHVLTTGTMFFCLWADQCGWSSVLFSSGWIVISYVSSISQELFNYACCCGPPFLLWNFFGRFVVCHYVSCLWKKNQFWFFLSQWQNFCLTVFFCLSSSRFP